MTRVKAEADMGRYFYEAILSPYEKGWEARIPDLGIVTQGADVADAAYMAQDALALRISSLLAEGRDVPERGRFGAACPAGGMAVGILTLAEPGSIFDETMSVREAADVLGVTRARIHALIAAGKLRSVKSGNTRMISASDVMARFNAPHPAGRPAKGAALG